MPTRKERIQAKAIEILRNTPEGVRYSRLVDKIKSDLPDVEINTIESSIWNLDITRPKEVYKPGRGIFRHVSFREQQTAAEESQPLLTSEIKESDFYASFAGYLENDLQECTKAIPLGGRVFEDKWGTPDVIGIERSSFKDIIQRQVIIVSAEIKTDTQGLITAFGQACAYGSFSHKTYIVVPKSSSPDDQARLDSLCSIFGIGLIFFDSTNPQKPQFEVRVRAFKHEPDMFYVNKYLKIVPEQLFR